MILAGYARPVQGRSASSEVGFNGIGITVPRPPQRHQAPSGHGPIARGVESQPGSCPTEGEVLPLRDGEHCQPLPDRDAEPEPGQRQPSRDQDHDGESHPGQVPDDDS